jgi:hypothetical protein
MINQSRINIKRVYDIAILTIVSTVILFSSCKKLANEFLPASKETELAREWNVTIVSKDGVVIHSASVSPLYSMGIPNPPTDISFYGNGEINQYCGLLNPFQRSGCYGIWQLTDKKNNIQITLTDSLKSTGQYNPNTGGYNYVISAMQSPVIINWKILNISTTTFQTQEIRTDGVYEFTFELNHHTSP